jgi:hypothetical protein
VTIVQRAQQQPFAAKAKFIRLSEEQRVPSKFIMRLAFSPKYVFISRMAANFL